MSVARKLLTLLAVLLSVGVIFVVVNQQRIIDQIRVWDYAPSQAIAQLAERSGLSEKGRFYFYVARPELVLAERFNNSCHRAEYSSPILGCYVPVSDAIYIYNVDNEQLDGIEEVTAAHEMLHAVFARMSAQEVRDVSVKLEAVYERLKTPKLEDRMAQYEEVEPGSRINELHSIIPTEFQDIGEELEQYYRQYFDDRLRVVALHDSYSKVFDDLERDAASLSQSLESERGRIGQMRATYERELGQLNADIATFNRQADSGYFTTREEFDIIRARLIGRAAVLDQQHDELNGAIDEYNRGVERLNMLGKQADQLNRSLDSLEAAGL